MQGQSDTPEALRGPSPNVLANIDDVRHMEEKMLRLLEEFESGRLVSVGASCPYDKLDAVREQQEELMRLHFALDNKVQNAAGSTSMGNRRQARRLLMEEGRKASKSNLSALIAKPGPPQLKPTEGLIKCSSDGGAPRPVFSSDCVNFGIVPLS